MALCLQEHRIGAHTWRQWWGELDLFDEHATEIMDFLRSEGYFEVDGDLLVIGSEAERRFGNRYFSDLTAVFSAAPEFTVLHGRDELGTVSSDLLEEEVDGPRALLLAGRGWEVTSIDWSRRRCQVQPSEHRGKARWGFGSGGLSFAVTRGMRDVLLGTDPAGVTFTRRVVDTLTTLREHHADDVSTTGTVVRDDAAGEPRWWTWAGSAANRTLHASLPEIVDPHQGINDRSLRLQQHVSRAGLLDALSRTYPQAPAVNEAAVTGLKFSAALPHELAVDTIATRLADPDHARRVLAESVRFAR